jgi:hypothetical protein
MSENKIEIINQREVELLEKNHKINLQKLFTQEGIDSIIAEIKNEVADFSGDITTKKGQAEIKSMAAKIAKCKSPIKNLAMELKDESRKLIDSVNAQWNRYEEAMDNLRDEIRRPVDEIEEKEAAELKAKQDQLGFLEHLKNYIPDSGFVKMSESYANALKRADELMNFDWQDFQFKADATFDQVKSLLQSRLDAALKNEAEQAELARIEAEKKAKEDAEKAAEIAIENERKRVEEEERKEREMTEKREKNKRHRNKINGEILMSIMELNKDAPHIYFPQDALIILIEAIAKGEVPHISINY